MTAPEQDDSKPPPISGQTTDAEVVAALRAELAAVYASTSWRLTAPLRAIRRKPPESSEEAPPPRDPEVELIEQSGFFDASFYAGANEARSMGISPIEHYIRHGEAARLAPSARFDPAYYARRYDDVVKAGRGLLTHYLLSGRDEGRHARAMADDLDFQTARIDPALETVIVAVHEATRTGAAILAWNIIRTLRQRKVNVVTLLKRGGPITQALQEASSAVVTLPENFVTVAAETDALARQFKACYGPLYMIANSVETRYYVSSFERLGIPTVSLIHEFSSTVRPLGELNELFVNGSQLVFSANVVAQSALDDYKSLHARSFQVIAQGASQLPPEDRNADAALATRAPTPQGIPDNDGSIWVVGIGTITLRKGVEFFIAAAAGVRRMNPTRKVRFGWIGKCYWFDQPYLEFLNQQVKRSGVESSFQFLSEFEDLEPVYRRADICFLSSRLDPLPNVTIDAALRGIPTVCFDEASGMAEILKADEQTRGLVVPYLDAEAAARVIVELADSPEKLDAYAEAMRTVAAGRFDMGHYVDAIDKLGREAISAHAQVERDRLAIARHEAFDASLFLGPLASTMTADEALRKYLHASRIVAARGQPLSGYLVRRPLAGFHPFVYASDNTAYDEASGEDPLAHYVRTGYPEGRWRHSVLATAPYDDDEASTLRVAIHAHFHYPELLEEFITRLQRNRTTVDLLITTTTPAGVEKINAILSRAGDLYAAVELVPNKGRDIGPFLDALQRGWAHKYDVVGHFHGKRSPHIDSLVSDGWRDFLWGHLLGGEHATMDSILAAFATDPAIGLVFPEDPHLNDWDYNREIAERLAARMGIDARLPNHFNFPQGTMFWTRPAAMAPLTNLRIPLEDYPDEPLPIDGTLLHAIERLIPFSAAHAGFRYATTHIKEFVR